MRQSAWSTCCRSILGSASAAHSHRRIFLDAHGAAVMATAAVCVVTELQLGYLKWFVSFDKMHLKKKIILILISPTPISQPNSPGSSTKPTKLKFVCVCVHLVWWVTHVYIVFYSVTQRLCNTFHCLSASLWLFFNIFNFWSQRNLKTFV